jgi:hypothetical protein
LPLSAAIAAALGFNAGRGGGDDDGQVIDDSDFIGTWRNTFSQITDLSNTSCRSTTRAPRAR